MKIKEWLRTRFGTKPIEKHIIYHRVTKTPWYYGDGATLLLLFGSLVITGMFMALDYSPSPTTAYESVQHITQANKLGWFVRAVHYWSAGMMVVMLMYHVLRHLLLGGYLPPREGIWLIGVGLFALTFLNAFTGYTLRWDERAVYAIRVALNIFHNFPLIGDELVVFIQGGWTMGTQTLSRLYAVHVIFVPFSISALIAYHVYLVLKYEPTIVAEREEPPSDAKEQMELRERERHSSRGHEFYPFTMGRSSLFGLSVLAFVIILVMTYGPAELYPKANFTETSFPREEWWFAWYSGIAAYLPPNFAPYFYFLFPIVVIGFLIALPFVDRSENRGLLRRPLAGLFVACVILSVLAFTGLRLTSPWTAWPRSDLPPIPPGFELTETALEGRALFREFGCYNCHAIGGHGSGFAPNLTGLDRKLSQEELKAFVLEPPSGVAMPAFKDRISPEDLERVVAFVLVSQTFPKEYEAAKE